MFGILTVLPENANPSYIPIEVRIIFDWRYNKCTNFVCMLHVCMVEDFLFYLMLQWLEEVFLPYLEAWERSVESREGFTAAQKQRMLLSSETRLGLKMKGIIIIISGLSPGLFRVVLYCSTFYHFLWCGVKNMTKLHDYSDLFVFWGQPCIIVHDKHHLCIVLLYCYFSQVICGFGAANIPTAWGEEQGAGISQWLHKSRPFGKLFWVPTSAGRH